MSESNIGMHVEYGAVTGVIDRIEKTGNDIVNHATGEIAGKAFRFRIRPDGGGRAVWTSTFPDRDGSIEAEWVTLVPDGPGGSGVGVRRQSKTLEAP